MEMLLIKFYSTCFTFTQASAHASDSLSGVPQKTHFWSARIPWVPTTPTSTALPPLKHRRHERIFQSTYALFLWIELVHTAYVGKEEKKTQTGLKMLLMIIGNLRIKNHTPMI